MPPFGIVSDIHFHDWDSFSKMEGDINSRLALQITELKRAAMAVLNAGGTNLYIAGDTFHVRGSIATRVLNPVTKAFDDIIRLGVQVRAIPGNHDLVERSATWNGSAVSAMYSVGVECVVGPTYYADDNVVMIPWIESLKDLRAEMIRQAAEHPGSDLIIHAPMNGVLRGIPPHGLDPAQIERLGFGRIFCGHYHNHTQLNDRVWSIGALTHQTWSDVGTKAGFMIVADSGVSHVESAAPKFVDYDPANPGAVQGAYARFKTGVSDQSEVAKYRECLIALGAEGAVIHAVPTPTAGVRSSTVQAGASTAESVAEYIRAMDTEGVDEGELVSACIDILSEVS